jgi:hypothetical protein
VRSLERYGLYESTLDHIVAFWRWGEKRHAVFTNDYSTTCDYLQVIRRRRGHEASSQSAIRMHGSLRESGEVSAEERGAHCYGLMRPLVLGGLDAIRDVGMPFLIAFELEAAEAPQLPIFAASRNEAALLVKRLATERNIDAQRWRRYECEPVRGAIESLIHDLKSGRPATSFSSELERQLWFAMHPQRLRRRPAA